MQGLMANVLQEHSLDVLFLLLGAVMIFAMHAGFAFLEAGSVRRKSQVDALSKIIFDWGLSTVVYFLVGFPIARGISFWSGAEGLFEVGQMDMIRFFLYLGFAACVPAIISGGIAERAKFWTTCIASAVFVGLAYPFLEACTWGQLSGAVFGEGSWLARWAGAGFHDFAGSVVVHSMGGWLALPAVLILGPRLKRYGPDGTSYPIRVSSIPHMVLGSWILCAGWFGFNVMSAGGMGNISSLVAINSLMAMSGGILAGMLFSRNDVGFTHNGALAGLVAVCAGSDLYHPLGALAVGAIAGLIFVLGFPLVTERLKVDDVLGVWPLHGLCGSWGGIAVGIFGMKWLGGVGGSPAYGAAAVPVSLGAQVVVTLAAALYAFLIGAIVFGVLKATFGVRLSEQQEVRGVDLTVHHVEAYPEQAL